MVWRRFQFANTVVGKIPVSEHFLGDSCFLFSDDTTQVERQLRSSFL
jgi:hypothetical protein